MAQLQQTSITGSLEVSGSSIIMPNLTASVYSGSSGQMWIDDSEGLLLKFTQVGSYGSQNSPFTCLGAWSVGGNLIISDKTSQAGTGASQTDLISAGGSPAITNTEEYNGSTWSAGGSMSTARWTRLAGTQNSTLASGGATPTRLSCTEEYNGSSWSSGGALINTRADGGSAGYQNAAIYVAGYVGGPSLGSATEEYNGSSWAAGSSTPSVNFGGNSYGTQNDTLHLLGGTSPSGPAYGATTCALNYDGTSWSQTNSLLNCHSVGGRFGVQSTSAAGVAGGGTHSTSTNITEEWNGLTWTLGCNLPASTKYSTGGGSQISAGVWGDSPASANMYEYTKTLLSPFTYDAAPSSDSWSGGGNMITARRDPSRAGTQNSALAAGGLSPSIVSCTEEYDGSIWSAGGALINARFVAFGDGTQNAAFTAGGSNPSYIGCTEEYDGSSWSAGGAMITTRDNGGAAGTLTAGLIFGGFSPSIVSCTEEYDGSTWAVGGALSTARYILEGGGSQTSAIAFGGDTATSPAQVFSSATEEYNGTAWSTGGSLNVARSYLAGDSTSTDDAIATGGGNPTGKTTCVEEYNGISWNTAISFPGNGRNTSAAAGNSSALTMFGGLAPGITGETLLYTRATNVDSTIPYCLGTWSGAAAMITATNTNASAGSTNSALSVAGNNNSNPLSCTEEYNGTSWTAGGAVPIALRDPRGGGSQNAAYIAGGATNQPGTGLATEAYNYDGATWSASGNMATARRLFGSCAGTQNAGIVFGGETSNVGGSPSSATEEYNGSTWSSGGNLTTAGRRGGAGTQNDTAAVGGYNPTLLSCTEEYNGTSWSSGGALIIATRLQAVSGEGSYNVFSLSGQTPTDTTGTQKYNGASWSIDKPLSTSRTQFGATGTPTSTLVFGGNTPSLTAATEEYTYGVYCVSAWNLGGNLTTARREAQGSGGINSNFVAGGTGSPSIANTEVYNGISWSTAGDLINTNRAAVAGGNSDGGYVATGNQAPTTLLSSTELFDGSTWASGPNVNRSRRAAAGSGTQNDGIMAGGNVAPSSSTVTCTEEYNGTSWSAGGVLNQQRRTFASVGNSGGAVVWGGDLSLPGIQAISCVENYDGSSWSTGDALLEAEAYNPGGGNSDGSNVWAPINCSSFLQCYNGFAWSVGQTNPLKANENTSGGDMNSGLIVGGGANNCSNTQEFNLSNPINCGLYCFTKNLAPGATDAEGTPYGSSY